MAANATAARAYPSWLPFLLILLGFAIAWGVGWYWWRKRGEDEMAPAAPLIQRPRIAPKPVQPQGEAGPKPASGAVPAATATAEEKPQHSLGVAIEPRSLAITLVQTTLTYRLILSNGGKETVEGIMIEGDMVSAHNSIEREQQVATAGGQLGLLHTIPRLKPGENIAVEGRLSLPLHAVVPVKHRNMVLYVPLVRLRIATGKAGGGETTILQTALIGQPSEQVADRLMPFRLDQGPRIYSQLLHRSFA